MTFDPDAPLRSTLTASATLSCDAGRTACAWTSDQILLAGTYTVTAYGIDDQGNTETAIAPIRVTVL